LSSDGSTLAVGIPQFQEASTDSLERPRLPFGLGRKSKGAVQMYRWGNHSWELSGLKLIGRAAGDELGQVVKLSSKGTFLAASAPTAHKYAGVTSLYKYRANTSHWGEVDAIKGENPNENWGYAIALSADGSLLVVSTPFAHGDVRGQVRVFKQIDEEWQQLGTTLNGIMEQDKFGWSVSIGGETDTTLVASAYQDERSGISNGAIRTFQWRNGDWRMMEEEVIGESGEHLGTTVALSADGKTLATCSENGFVRFYAAPR
jgi:WD40 repeat protein